MIAEKFTTVNIIDCLKNKIEGFGEAELKRALSAFSSIDPRVETFLKNSAEEFSRQRKSVTHLVFSNDRAKLVGYFTLTIKSLTVDAKRISKTTARALKKTGSFDVERNAYTAGAYLIGQLGRNFAPSLKNKISGNELLEVALHLLKGIQNDVGGLIVFLEAQDNDKVLSFYGSNGFREFDRRVASSSDGELIQLIKVL